MILKSRPPCQALSKARVQEDGGCSIFLVDGSSEVDIEYCLYEEGSVGGFVGLEIITTVVFFEDIGKYPFSKQTL